MGYSRVVRRKSGSSHLTFAFVLAALLAAVGAGAGIQEKYFNGDWSRAEMPVVPDSIAAAASFPSGQDGPIDILHNPFAHMYITRRAYEMYASRYDGGELSRHIGDYNDAGPDSDKDDTVVAGSYDEDKSFKNPFNEAVSVFRHFWDCRKGFARGLFGYDSAVNRAHKYWTGGFGVDGRYDEGWSSNAGSRRGKKGAGVLALYRRGDKAKAFWYLGHVAHLLEDITVPAHAHLWPHPVKGADAYETYMATHHRDWKGYPPGAIESFDTLFDLFLRTAEVSKGFDAGFDGEDMGGKDGEKDGGRRRADGFTQQELKEAAACLMPLSVKRVAALFVLFYKQVDQTPPTATLLVSGAPPRVVLSASARDTQSGIDKYGYRFEYSVLAGGSWTPWTQTASTGGGPSVSFEIAPGGSYAFRVWATDAAANSGVSEVVTLGTGALALTGR